MLYLSSNNNLRRPRALDSRLHRRTGRGFTVIELLTVIGIISILMALLFVALKYVRNSASAASTRVSLASLNGMLGELEAANQLAGAPTTWMWYASTNGSFTVSSGTTFGTGSTNFWKFPFTNSFTNGGVTPVWDALDSPGDVRADTGTAQDQQRNCSFAIINTQLAMQAMAAVSANRAALNKLGTDHVMLPAYTTGAGAYLAPIVSPSMGLLKDDLSDGTTSFPYPLGFHLTYNGNFYRAAVPGPSAAPAPNLTTPWFDETSAPQGAPLLKDGWGNPIIFVPASGLHVRLLNGKSKYDPTDLTQVYIITSHEGIVTGNGGVAGTPTVTKVGKPFWASAGPDGDFTKGEDNIYSFEQ